MKYILMLAIGLLTIFQSKAQATTHYIDSLATTMINIKEELIMIKENYYIIMPYGIAGNIGVYLGKDQVVLVDDQWSVLSNITPK